MTSIFITLYSFPQDQFWPPCHWESEEIATDCVLLQEIFTNIGSREPTRCPITYRPKSLSLVEAKVLDRWVVKFIARWGTIKKPVARWGITYFRISEHWVKKSVTISRETGGTILDRWVKKTFRWLRQNLRQTIRPWNRNARCPPQKIFSLLN